MRLTLESAARCQARVGRTLGAFRLERLLGIGASAAVYEAVQPVDDRMVALKVLHDELRSSKEACVRLARQVDVSARVTHPNVVRVHELVHTETDVFVVMDRLVGESAAARMKHHPQGVEPREVVRWTFALLDALEAVHAHGIIHRDIKPANILLHDEGKVPVFIDFGCASLRDADALTRTGQLLGTPAFMPPELANGEPRDADSRSDLWGLAATMFFLLTGECVHPARSSAQQLLYAATQPARSLGAVRRFDAALVAAVDRALRFNVKERFASASELRDALALSSLA